MVLATVIVMSSVNIIIVFFIVLQVKYAVATTNHAEHLKVVSPDWVIDCVRQKTKLSEVDYHPKLQLTEDDAAALRTFNEPRTSAELSQHDEQLKVILTPLTHVAKATVRASAIAPLSMLTSLPQEDESSFDIAAPSNDAVEGSDLGMDDRQITDVTNLQSSDDVAPTKKKQRSRCASTSPRNAKNRDEKMAKGGAKGPRAKSVAKVNKPFILLPTCI